MELLKEDDDSELLDALESLEDLESLEALESMEALESLESLEVLESLEPPEIADDPLVEAVSTLMSIAESFWPFFLVVVLPPYQISPAFAVETNGATQRLMFQERRRR